MRVNFLPGNSFTRLLDSYAQEKSNLASWKIFDRTGLQAGRAYHKIVNAHIYEDQLEQMRDIQLKRKPFPSPKLLINPEIKKLEDIETWVTLDDFKVENYLHHEAIQYSFSV